MKKSFKKIVAWACAITMMVSSMAVYNLNIAKADIYSEDTTEWESWFSSGQTIASNGTTGYTVTDGVIGTTWWNIQTWLPAVNFTKGYTYSCSFTLTTSAPKQFKVDNRSNDATIFTETSTEGWVDNGDGTYSYDYTGVTSEMTSTSQIDVRVSFGYFDDGTEYDGWAANDAISLTMSDFAITREATGETEADPTTAGADESGYTQLKDATDTIVGEWTLYAGSWGGGSMSYKGGTDDLALKVISSNNNPGAWSLQAKRAASVYAGLTEGTEYTLALKYTSTAAGSMFVKLEGANDGTTYTTVTGENTINVDFTYVATMGALVLELGGIPAGTEITNISFEFSEAAEETTTVEEEPTEEESSVEEPTEEETSVEAGEVDYSTLTYSLLGQSQVVGSTDKVNVYYAVSPTESTGSIVDWMTTGSGKIELYGDMWMSATWHGNYPDAVLNINGTDIVSGMEGVAVANNVQANVQATVFLNNNDYNTVKITSADGSEYVTFVLMVGNIGGDVEETTTPEETTVGEAYEWQAIDYASLTYADEATLATYFDANAKYATVGTCPIDNVVAEADGMWILAGAYGKAIQVYLNGELKQNNTNNSAIGYKMPWSDIPTSNQYNDITIVFTAGDGTVTEYRYVIAIEGAAPVIDAGVNIYGWQVACGNIVANGKTYDGGIRTVYAIDDTVDGKSTEGATVGLVYGLVGSATEDDMVVGSSSDYVTSTVATANGVLTDEDYGQSADSTLYAVIMAANLSKSTAAKIQQEYMVRAYVEIDGAYYYSDVETYSVYSVAQALYDNSSMQTEAGHEYVYNILAKVDPEYPVVTYPVVDNAVVGGKEE